MKTKILVLLFVLLVAVSIIMIVIAKKNKQKDEAASNGNAGTGGTKPNSVAAPAPAANVAPVVVAETTTFPLKYGSRGKAVKVIQIACGLTGTAVDGIWGNATEREINSRYEFNTFVKQDFYHWFIEPAYGNDMFPLKAGQTNNWIGAVQVVLGLSGTRYWGDGTTAAVKAATGKTELTASDYERLISLALGLTDAQTINTAAQVLANGNQIAYGWGFQ